MKMALLGDDGRGYELARKLESHGVWRPWLGDALYSTFIPFLTSPAAWDAFMRADDSKSKPQISLQLRARALLFDKASVSLFAQHTAVSKLNPNCEWNEFCVSPIFKLRLRTLVSQTTKDFRFYYVIRLLIVVEFY